MRYYLNRSETLTFESADQHSEMSRILRNQLQLSDVKISVSTANVAKLRLVSTSTDSKVVSVFKQAREAENLNAKTLMRLPIFQIKGTLCSFGSSCTFLMTLVQLLQKLR